MYARSLVVKAPTPLWMIFGWPSPFAYDAYLVVDLVRQLAESLVLYILEPIPHIVYIPKSERHHYPITRLVNWLIGMMLDSSYEALMRFEDMLYRHPRPFTSSREAPARRKRSFMRARFKRGRPSGKPPQPPRNDEGTSHEAWAAAAEGDTTTMVFDSDSFLMLVDSGASKCMTNNLDHFCDQPKRYRASAKGLGSAKITMKGTGRWSWEDDNGVRHTKDIPGMLYCKELPFCLMSPQHLAQALQDKDGTGLDIGGRVWTLYWNGRRNQRTIPLTDENGNVCFIRSAAGYKKSNKFVSLCSLCTKEEGIATCLPAHLIPRDDDDEDEIARDPAPEQDITTGESRHARNHDVDSLSKVGQQRLVTFEHEEASFSNDGTDDDANVTRGPQGTRIELDEEEDVELEKNEHELLRLHYKMGHLPFKQLRLMAANGDLPKRLANCRAPKCSACLFAQATKRAWRTRAPTNSGSLATATRPGEVVSIDQLESSTPGLIAQLKGWVTKKRYKVVTVFVDHFSDLSYVHMQQSTDGPNTLAAKLAFEAYARSHGVAIKHYHSDNGRFAEALFVDHATKQGQTVSYCGVNAHFQNGKAEKRIRDLQDRARTMLVHAKHRWRNAITANLWPYAIRIANEVHKTTPRIRDGASPLELFGGAPVDINLSNLQPFGCPVYVLDDKMQSDKKGPKWSERARCGIYLGPSPRHARNVALVLSLETGMVSPQFHVTFDPLFETVRTNGKSPVVGLMPSPSLWQVKLGFVEGDVGTVSEGEGVIAPSQQDVAVATQQGNHTPHQSPETENPTAHVPNMATASDVPQGEVELSTEVATSNAPDNGSTAQPPPPASPGATSLNLRRSQRQISKPTRLIEEFANYSVCDGEVLSVQSEFDIQDAMGDPFAFTASADQDTMYLHEAKRQPDWLNFKAAMKDEVSSHEEGGHWELVPRTSVPEGVDVLPSVWSMKRKRRISTREVYKWKARLNVHGGKQTHGVNFWETYSPVVQWSSIRLFLIISLLKGWHTRQIDFVLAYPQADIETELFMEIPQGFHFGGTRRTHCLRLKKNIYGAKSAGRTWNKHLHRGLIERGYRQSLVDHCVYYKGASVFMVYVDDGIYAGPDASEIDELISSLGRKDGGCEVSFKVTDEGEIDDYLGVKVERLPDGKNQIIATPSDRPNPGGTRLPLQHEDQSYSCIIHRHSAEG